MLASTCNHDHGTPGSVFICRAVLDKTNAPQTERQLITPERMDHGSWRVTNLRLSVTAQPRYTVDLFPLRQWNLIHISPRARRFIMICRVKFRHVTGEIRRNR